jgi:MYXO-CTERM domain-containing protein
MSVDAGIEMPVVPPVLADGLWPHTASSVSTPKQYTQSITLPTKPCTKCVLQVLQIMLNHPVNPPNNVPGAGFTYHHCAYISIEPGAGGGTQTSADAGTAGGAGSSGAGCACSTAQAPGSGSRVAGLAAFAAAGALVRRRRRRAA